MPRPLHIVVRARRVATAMLLMFVTLDCAAPDASSVLLTEIASLALSDSFDVRGAIATANGYVVWSSTQSYAIFLDDSGAVTLEEIQGEPAGIVIIGDEMRFIDRNRLEEVVLRSANGQVLRRRPFRPLPHLARIEQAVWSGSSWIVTTRDSSGNWEPMIAHQLADSSWKASATAPEWERSAGEGQGLRISECDCGAVLAEVRAPFRRAVISPTGDLTSLESVPAKRLAIGGATRQDSARWVALAIHQVGDEFVQTIADLNSDTRFLIRTDARGRMRSSGQVEVPLGILGASSSRRTMLTLQRLNQQRLVIYNWQITDDRAPSSLTATHAVQP